MLISAKDDPSVVFVFTGKLAPILQIFGIIRAKGLSGLAFNGLNVFAVVHQQVNFVSVGVSPKCE